VPQEGDSPGIEKTSPASDPSEPEIARVDQAVGQSRGNEPTDAELERGVLDALSKGLDGVAKTLSEQLSTRQRARVPS
jgi:hypothetical protein